MANFQDYLNELAKTVRKSIVKIELLRTDESPLYTIDLSELRTDGSLNVNKKNGLRRSVSFTLDNTTKKFFPSLDSNIWVNQKIKLYMGLLINGEEYLLPQGVFVLDDPTVTSDGAVQISAVDKWSKLDGSLGGFLSNIIIINAGTNLRTALKTIMSLTGDVKDIIVDNSLATLTLPYQLIHEEGSTYGSIIEELALAFSANCYYNEDGALVFEKDVSDATKGSIWTFTSENSETNYQGGNTSHKFSNAFNYCLVLGDNINGAIARGVAQNNDLLSPTSIPNIGLKPMPPINDNIISTSPLAVERAKYELKRATVVLTESSISSVPLYHLDVDRVVEIYDDYLNFNGKRSVIDSYTIPLNNASMSLGLVDTFEITLT